MAVTKQFTQLDPINNGTTPADNFKLSDVIPAQHTDLTGGVNKLVHRTLAQSLCEPVAVCNSNNPQNGAYTATCQNYPDFALSYQDAQQNTQYLIGLKIRVIFTYGITYGSVSGGTYPTLNINGSGAIPMLAQGKTMATGSASAGQSIEFTIIPYGNGVAFDADSNVRESTSDYTIYTDGLKRIDNIDTSKNMPTSNAVKNALKTSGTIITSINSIPFNGYTTSGAKRMYFFIPIKLDGSENISITELTVVARSVEGKYIDAPYETGFDALQSPYSINVVKVAMLGIYIYINKTSSFVNNGTTEVVPNNTPVAVTPKIQMTIS